eukprot:m.136231 g.136231  ORF g.136231 m.136231 type:complete len:99 (-) comp10526_c0_seq1:131-427(-)
MNEFEEREQGSITVNKLEAAMAARANIFLFPSSTVHDQLSSLESVHSFNASGENISMVSLDNINISINQFVATLITRNDVASNITFKVDPSTESVLLH